METSGPMEMDVKVADVTLKTELPVIPLKVAETVALPDDIPVAFPFKAALFSIVAIPVSDELQVTSLVKSWVLPSEKVPVAL